MRRLTLQLYYASVCSKTTKEAPIRPETRIPHTEQHRINSRIRVPKVRLIASDGAQVGIVDTQDAMRMAREEGLDLVEVAAKAVPPVCKIMDYGKFKYELAKKERQERARRTVIEVKEIKIRPQTEEHDYSFKVKHIREFLSEGNKARLIVQFRGREIMHPEHGRAMLKRIMEACSDLGQLEQAPMMEGKKLIMIVAPKAGLIKPAAPRPATPVVSNTTAAESEAAALSELPISAVGT